MPSLPVLWSGPNAGFTQVNVSNSPVNNFRLNNSMLFLIGSVSKEEFTQGLFKAASTALHMTYSPLDNKGRPTTAVAGVAFPGNDWIMSPCGDGYLVNLVNPSRDLLKDLAALRQEHLEATASLLKAIDKGEVGFYLRNKFKCP